ncbi:PKD2, partial [Symbiodinium necroappetens]
PQTRGSKDRNQQPSDGIGFASWSMVTAMFVGEIVAWLALSFGGAVSGFLCLFLGAIFSNGIGQLTGIGSAGGAQALSMLTMITVPCGLLVTVAAALVSVLLPSSWEQKVQFMLWANLGLASLFLLYAMVSTWPGFYMQERGRSGQERLTAEEEAPSAE